MPSSSAVVRSLVLAGLCLGMAPAYAQESSVTDPPAPPAAQAASKPASKAASKSQPAKKPAQTAAKPESRQAPEELRPSLPPANSRLLPVTLANANAVPSGDTAGSIAFEGRSADLDDEGKAALDRLARDAAARNMRRIELCAFSSGIAPDNRQVALARAYVVRGYLLGRGVKAQIGISGFASDSERVDIVVPST